MKAYGPIEFSQDEGNLLIAAFDGKSVYPKKDQPGFRKWKGERRDFEIHQLNYHLSFDALIPVCIKLRTLASESIPSPMTDKGMVTTTSDIYEKYKTIEWSLSSMDIGKLWYATVWFIHWLKENKHI